MILFLDSCDHYTDPAHKYDSNNLGAIVAGGGRNSTACLRLASNDRRVTKAIPSAPSTIIVGFAFRRENLIGGGAIVQFAEAGTVHASLSSEVNGALSISGGGGTLGSTSAGVIVGGVFAYIEVKITVHDTTGSAVVRVNGVPLVSLSNVDTSGGGTGVVDNIVIRAAAGNFDFDDIYIADTLGGVNDDFLGDVRVQYRAPTGAGNSTAWTPSTGANWENVDDAAPDGDSTYNSAVLSGSEDLYACAALSGSPTSVYAVQVINRVREDDSLGHTIAPMIRASGVTDTGTAVTVNNNYATKTEVWNENPDASAWDPADFPIEAGISLES